MGATKFVWSYYLPDREDADSATIYTPDPGRQAVCAAEHFWQNRGGWESTVWPKDFVILCNGKEWERSEVDMESIPHFFLCGARKPGAGEEA